MRIVPPRKYGILAALAFVVAMLGGPGARPAAGAELELLGQIGGWIRVVALHDDLAFVGEGTGLTVLDLASPATPLLLGSLPLPDRARDIAVSGTVAFVTMGERGVLVVDVSDPAAPVPIGSFDTPGVAGGIEFAGSSVYVGDGPGGLRILDVANPASPASLGLLPTTDARDVALLGDVAYVADAENLYVVDISNHADPTLVETSFDVGGRSVVRVSGDLAATNGVRFVDVSDPRAPVRRGSFNRGENSNVAALSGINAYVVDNDTGLYVVDVSNPSSPVETGFHATVHPPTDVTVDGSIACLSVEDFGMEVVDVSNVSAPLPLGSYGLLPSRSLDVAIVGTFAYVANGYAGLRIVDLSNPAEPTLAGLLDTPDYAQGVLVVGSIAYVADGYSSMQIVDVSNPAAPALLASFAAGQAVRGLAVSGDRAYLATDLLGLQVVDISDPSSPVLLGSYDTESSAADVAVSDGIAYLADGFDFLALDVSGTSPTLLGSYDNSGWAVDVALSESFAFVANSDEGLLVLDISDPSSPTPVGSFDSPMAIGVAVHDSVAYVADYELGLITLDVSSPTTPTFLARYPMLDDAWDVVAADGLVCLAGGRAGLHVLRLDESAPSSPPVSNLSTRGFVSLGGDVMIGGMIVSGNGPADARRVLISGIGPDLANFGVTGALANPSLFLLSGQTILASNDDWRNADPDDVAAIVASGKAPGNSLEAAILADLAPGEYTAILSGVAPEGAPDSARTGVALVQAFDLGPAPGANPGADGGGRLSNLSTRMSVGTGDRVMIGGFTVDGDAGGPSKRVVVRGLGPTLGAPPFDVPGALADPELLVLSGSTVLQSNFDWRNQTDPNAPPGAAETIEALGLAPPDDREPAILITLAPGEYTAIVSGAGGASGVALIEVYEAD